MSVSCIPSGNFLILDFQGLFLGLPSASAPLATQLLDTPVPPNQLWELVTVNHGGRVLASGLSQSAGQAIVVATGPNGEAVGASSTGIAFTVTCLPTGSATLVDNGIALTASQVAGQNSSAPVTFEAFTGSSEQVWSLLALN
ncbi:hypothetical protein B0H12DRAFT_1231480 [Mycena haematopus]|nr:hypothetical protein B0H12DRAFT_1231480 [Mycena haematopus]